jgi:hypothetical protein
MRLELWGDAPPFSVANHAIFLVVDLHHFAHSPSIESGVQMVSELLGRKRSALS